jgi:hypothetical protein
MVLPDELPERLLGTPGEIRADPPDDLSGFPGNDDHEVGFARRVDDVGWVKLGMPVVATIIIRHSGHPTVVIDVDG